ncbi:MAG: acyl-ACP desaturase [Chloroflexi bacterium]|nr:acyl-ACP desaturase [Chloroflexota bacterium]MCI0856231.1 acyl-ACP desaturase [Chloroflexota bacterium]
MSDVPLLTSLEPEVARLLARHSEASARIDWSYRDFLPLEALHAPSNTPPLSELAYLAVETALLTEVNLPWYTAVLYEGLQDSLAPLQEFVRVWTSEEDQHSTLLETYLLLTDNGDPAERGRRRKAVIAGGFSHQLEGAFEAMVYTTIQELATQAFYVCTANTVEAQDATLSRALRRIAKDETRHYAFYRDVVKAHLEADPAYITPLVDVLISFQMPGRVMSDFDQRSMRLAAEGVFGPEQYYNDVVEVVCSFWNVDELAAGLPETRVALARLNKYRRVLRRMASRLSAATTISDRVSVA